jgi:hypothetical protein
MSVIVAAALAVAPQLTGVPAPVIRPAPASPEAQLAAAAQRAEAAADALAEGPRLMKAAPADVAIACPLALRFHDDMRSSRSDMSPRSDELAGQLRALMWKALPKRARCANGRTLTFQPKGFGDFVTAIAQSADGQFAGVSGGWQWAELAGGGADCLYKRRNETYVLVGCVETWAS